MSKVKQIREDMISSMKNGNKERKAVLSYLLGVIKNAEIDKRSELTDEEVNVIINKQIKQTQDVLAVVPADRTDLKKENEFTISVLKEYAPKMLDEAEIRHLVYSVCDELGLDVNSLTSKDKGKIMGKLMQRTKGIADGSTVSKVVSEYCK